MSIAPIGSVTAATTPSPAIATATGTPSSTTSGTGATTGTTTGASTGATKDPAMLDRDVFLKLLVAQLRYQDPNKPMDSAEMVSQSASLSVVDKLDQISQVLTDSGVANRLSLGSSIIGKQVTFLDPQGVSQTAIASSISFDGTAMVVRAGTFDVPVDSIRSVTAAPVSGAAAS
jgi:flagellar basal-body rod modification protein FlgD